MYFKRALLPIFLVSAVAFSQDEMEALRTLYPAFTEKDEGVKDLVDFFNTGGPDIGVTNRATDSVSVRGLRSIIPAYRGRTQQLETTTKQVRPLAQVLGDVPRFQRLIRDGNDFKEEYIAKLFTQARQNDSDLNYIIQEILDLPYRFNMDRLDVGFVDARLDHSKIEQMAKNKFHSVHRRFPEAKSKEDSAKMYRYVTQFEENETKKILGLVPKPADFEKMREYYLKELDRIGTEMMQAQLDHLVPILDAYHAEMDRKNPYALADKRGFQIHSWDSGKSARIDSKISVSVHDGKIHWVFKGADGKEESISTDFALSKNMFPPFVHVLDATNRLAPNTHIAAFAKQFIQIDDPQRNLRLDNDSLNEIVRDIRWRHAHDSLATLRSQISGAKNQSEVSKVFEDVKLNRLGTDKDIPSRSRETAIRYTQIQRTLREYPSQTATLNILAQDVDLFNDHNNQIYEGNETAIKWAGFKMDPTHWIHKDQLSRVSKSYSIKTITTVHEIARSMSVLPARIKYKLLNWYHRGLRLTGEVGITLAALVYSYGSLNDKAEPEPNQRPYYSERAATSAPTPVIESQDVSASDESKLQKIKEFLANFVPEYFKRQEKAASDPKVMTLSGAPQSASNTGESDAADTEKVDAFKVSQRGSYQKAQHFYLSDPSEKSQAAVLNPNAAKDLSISSQIWLQPQDGNLSIPSPDFHLLSAIEIKDQQGRRIFPELSYHPQSKTYSAKVPQDALYSMNADFSYSGGQPDAPEEYFHKSKLAEIGMKLEEAGFKTLAATMRKRMNGAEEVSAGELSKLFAENSYYTHAEEKISIAEIRKKNPDPNNPFLLYRGFLALGEACGECDVGNSMYRDAAAIAFKGRDDLSIRSRALLVLTPEGTLKKMGHEVSEIQNSAYKNYVPLRPDATPEKEMTPELLAAYKAKEAERQRINNDRSVSHENESGKQDNTPTEKKVDDFVIPKRTRAPKRENVEVDDERRDPPPDEEAKDGIRELAEAGSVSTTSRRMDEPQNPNHISREWKAKWSDLFEVELNNLEKLFQDANMKNHLQDFEGPMRSTLGQLWGFTKGHFTFEEMYKQLVPEKAVPENQWQGLKDIYEKYVDHSNRMKGAFRKMVNENPRMALKAPILLSKEIQEALTTRVKNIIADSANCRTKLGGKP